MLELPIVTRRRGRNQLVWKALHKSSKIFVEHALHVSRIQFRTQAQWLCAGYCTLSYDHQFLLAFKRQLDKVKTRLTTLYVVKKLITTTTIIDQLEVCKLEWILMLINTHISTHYKRHAFEQAYMIRGYGWGKGEENSFIVSTSRLTLLWPHFHDNLSRVIVHIYHRNTESPHLGPPIKIISNNIQRGILTIVLYLCSKCWMTWNCEPSCV